MVVHFGIHQKLGEGVYSVVYEVEGKALKLFRRFPHIPPKQTEEGRRLVFQRQCGAYERALHDPFLKNHIATYFGPCVIDDVVDEDENSVKDGYLLDCCYAVEVMGGIETKTASALRLSELERYPHISEAANRFAGIGIEVLDSSVYNADDAERFKFIDFELPFY